MNDQSPMNDLPIGFRPFLSCATSIDEVASWPQEKKNKYTWSIKYDGVRLLITDKEVYTRSLKPIPNRNLAEYIIDQRRILEIPENVILDCEFTHVGGFKESNIRVQTEDMFCFPDTYKIRIFDSYIRRPQFSNREAHRIEVHSDKLPKEQPFLFVHEHDLGNLLTDFTLILEKGHEGVMIRKKISNYKFGRATKAEATYFKVKPSYDSDAIILGMYEGETNINPKKKNKLGLTKRSSSLIGKRGNGILGTISCVDVNPNSPFYGMRFSIGTFEGLKDADLLNMYLNPSEFLNKKFTYKYASVASKGLPRHPVFQRFI